MLLMLGVTHVLHYIRQHNLRYPSLKFKQSFKKKKPIVQQETLKHELRCKRPVCTVLGGRLCSKTTSNTNIYINIQRTKSSLLNGGRQLLCTLYASYLRSIPPSFSVCFVHAMKYLSNDGLVYVWGIVRVRHGPGLPVHHLPIQEAWETSNNSDLNLGKQAAPRKN